MEKYSDDELKSELEDRGFYVYSEGESTIGDVEDAAEQLLKNYQCGQPSAGEVSSLANKIKEILVSDFGVSSGAL